jgi:uncharacterized protein YdeI (YjbR/CyaY-like superfamily)
MALTPHPLFFATPADLRAWFEANHARVSEVWIGYYKRESGRSGVTYRQAVDEALCFGWIDGQVRRLDAISYTNRYTPRRPGSIWSNVNTRRARELQASGRMTPAGLATFKARDPRAGKYSFEVRHDGLNEAYLLRLRRHPKAWSYFQAQPPHYRRTAGYWVMSAKQEVTRTRRFAQLLADCDSGRWLKQFISPKGKTGNPSE